MITSARLSSNARSARVRVPRNTERLSRVPLPFHRFAPGDVVSLCKGGGHCCLRGCGKAMSPRAGKSSARLSMA